MSTYSVVQCKSATLSSTTVDTINLSGEGYTTVVLNRAASGGADMSVTYAAGGTAATPTASGDDTYLVPAGMGLRLTSLEPVTQVKIIGNGNNYAVMQGP